MLILTYFATQDCSQDQYQGFICNAEPAVTCGVKLTESELALLPSAGLTPVERRVKTVRSRVGHKRITAG